MKIFTKKNSLYLFLIFHFFISLLVFMKIDFYFSYFIFSLTFGYVTFCVLKRFDSYAIIYLFILTYLGFWFKFSFFVIFNDYTQTYFIEQNRLGPHPNVLNYPKVLLISSWSFIVIYLNYLFYKKFLNKFFFSHCKINNLVFFLKNNFFLTFLIIFFFLIYFINFFYGIYYKGKLNSNFFTLVTNLTITILPYVFFCLLIDYSTNNRKKIKYLLLSFFTGFFESIVTLSRSTIFTQLSLFIPSFFEILKRVKIKKLIIFSVILLIIFLISVFIIDSLRFNKNYNRYQKTLNSKVIEDNNDKRILKGAEFIQNSTKKLKILFFDRWVGIDALINVLNNNERKFSNYFKKNNFYTSEFMPGYDLGPTEIYINTIITPGFIAYSHYADNLFLSFFILSIITFVIYFIEKFTLMLTYSKTLSSFLCFIAVWRTIHMGYSLFNTLALFLFLILMPVSLFILNKFFKNKSYDK